MLGDATGEQPLLDSRFPDVSAKGRGYQITAHPDGTAAWPELRKVSVWQTAAALQLEMDQRLAKRAEPSDAAGGGGPGAAATAALDADGVASALGADMKADSKDAAAPAPAAASKGGGDDGEAAAAKDAPAGGAAAAASSPGAKGGDAAADAAGPKPNYAAAAAAPADAGAQAKRGPGPLAPLTSPLGGGAKIARPHHIPSMKGQNNELEERLAKIRADMAGEGGAAAPWDEFGRPKQLSFKK